MSNLSPVSKIVLYLGILMAFSIQVNGQVDYGRFCHQSLALTNTGMFVLGGWAVANIAGGAVGWSKTSGSQKYFHQMNLFWNTVNLSISAVSLYSNLQADCSLLAPESVMARHTRTENTLLINSALDLGYLSTGILLKHLSGRSVNRTNLLKGYGNSLLLQGAFLLVFDLCLYGILRAQRLNF